MLCRSKSWQGLHSKAQMWLQHNVKPKVDVVKLDSQHLEHLHSNNFIIANTCSESAQMFGNSKLCPVDDFPSSRWTNAIYPNQNDICVTNNQNNVDLTQASTQALNALLEQEWLNNSSWNIDVKPQKLNLNKNEIMGASDAATTHAHNYENNCQYYSSNTNDAKRFENTYHGSPQGEELFLEKFSTTSNGKHAPMYGPNKRINKFRPLQTSKAWYIIDNELNVL